MAALFFFQIQAMLWRRGIALSRSSAGRSCSSGRSPRRIPDFALNVLEVFAARLRRTNAALAAR
jgi:hypothetical protein